MLPGVCGNRYSLTGASFYEACFATFPMHGRYPDRACILAVENDGHTEVTLVIRRGSQEEVLVVTDDHRAPIAFGERHGMQ